jgi:hypothetical protein
MSRTLAVITALVLIVLAFASLGGLVWTNAALVRNRPVDKDFLVPWLGARTFIQYGESPYGDPATQRAQVVYYGRLATEGQDPLRLWLPFPVELFFFPIALVPDYVLARAIWMTCLEIALVTLAFLSIRLAGWKPGRLLLPMILLFPLFWVYGAFSLFSGNASGFIALALAGFLLAMRNERDELAGALLLLMVSAPRLTGLLAFFIFWWIIFQRRWRILGGFLMGTVFLSGLAFLFLPGWLLEIPRGLLSHFAFNPGISLVGILTMWSPVVGLRLGWALAASLLLMLFLLWGNALNKDFRSFFWTACLTVSVTPLMGIPMVPMEYSFLFLPLILFLAILVERRSWIKRWSFTGIIMAAILGLLWFLTFALESANAYLALSDFLFLFLPIALVLGLFWMRWWFIHPVPIGLEISP